MTLQFGVEDINHRLFLFVFLLCGATTMQEKKTIGIVSGLNPRAALEVKTKLLAEAGDDVCVLMTEDTFKIDPDPVFAVSDRKIFIFNECELLADLGADLILVPDFKCGPYIHEIQREIQTPILDMKTALMAQMDPSMGTVGVLDAGNASACLDGACDLSQRMTFVMPDEADTEKLNELREQIRAQGRNEECGKALAEIAGRLVAKGAQVIIPNCTQFALQVACMQKAGIAAVDVFEAFAKAALVQSTQKLPKPFKLGLIGGLGPAATVDLYDKIVKASPAKTDQEHFKVVIEQNPQIDDRTACLLNDGPDPTIAMYNCAKHLQNDGCDYIIIPCNTAHAFLPRLLRHLDVPFIDMQQTMLDEIKAKFGDDARVGLLATSGTIATGIYGKKADAMGMKMFTPDEEHQKLVMSAIYGPQGAKAGFTTGVCYDELYKAAEYMVQAHDCNVLILGCTELPLIFHECDDFAVAGKTVAIVDPTATLARKCVEIAEATIKERGVR